MSDLLFYKEPVALSNETHRDLKLSDNLDFAFAADTNSVPLLGIEFYEAAKEYPILFVKVGEAVIPCILNGLKDKQNLFVSAYFKWDARYIPSYVRRYPFVVTEPSEDGRQGVFIDLACKRFKKKGGVSLFDEQGQETTFLVETKSFLSQHYAHAKVTENFCTWLKKENLFTEMAAKFQLASGEEFLFDHLLVIDEQKLMSLPQKKVMELFKLGWLGWIYAHLMSLTNMSLLVDRYAKSLEK